MQKSEQKIKEDPNDNGDSSSEASVITVSSVNDSDNSGDSTECLNSNISNKNSINESFNLSDVSNLLNINHPNNLRPSVINEDLDQSLSANVTDSKYELIMSKLNIDHLRKIIPEFDGSPKNLDKFLACCEIIHNPLNAEDDKSLFLDILKSICL